MLLSDDYICVLLPVCQSECLCLFFFFLPFLPAAQSRRRFIFDFLNVPLPVPLPARRPARPPVFPPAFLDIGIALYHDLLRWRATGASATGGPRVLSCRVMSSCHRGARPASRHSFSAPPPPCALIGFPSSLAL